MKKKLGILIGLLLIFTFCICLCFSSFIGIAPFSSSIFNKQKDLGVDTNQEYALELESKIGFEDMTNKSDWPFDHSLDYSGQKNIDVEISSEELSSILQKWEKQWTSTPFENIQVKLGDNGEVEISANLNIEKTKEFAKTLNYSEEQIESAVSYAKLLGNDLSIYAKGKFEINNNDVEISGSQLKIKNINVPSGYFVIIEDGLESILEKRISQIPNLSIEKFTVSEGKAKLIGTIPQAVNDQE